MPDRLCRLPLSAVVKSALCSSRRFNCVFPTRSCGIRCRVNSQPPSRARGLPILSPTHLRPAEPGVAILRERETDEILCSFAFLCYTLDS